MNSLEKAHIEIEKVNVDFGINFEELKNNPQNHNKEFWDKWGIPWKYENDTLYYSDEGYNSKYKREWNEANMGGCDLPYKKYFTLEQFKKIKPSYL